MKCIIKNKLGDIVSFDDAIEVVQGIEFFDSSTKILLLHIQNKTTRSIVIEDSSFEDVAKAVGWGD